MQDFDSTTPPSQSDDHSLSVEDYLRKAAQACTSGNNVLGMHLYLAAFERSNPKEGEPPNEAALAGLKKAWSLACSLRERSLAEYVFEQMEPYLTADETEACAARLQDLALDKLEEYGLSREELEDMTDMISQDLMGMNIGAMFDLDRKTLAKRSKDAAEARSFTKNEAAEEKPGRNVERVENINFSKLVGYDRAVAGMRDFGIGMQDDAQFQALVQDLNKKHGLDGIPACDTLLFRSPAREDANRFASAVFGELALPAVRMHMEENMQGLPVLCVMAQADNQPKLNHLRDGFEGPGVLILEDLDTWISPMMDAAPDDFGGFIMASLSRGAREAVAMIRSAVENPQVYVLATMAESGEIDPFFFELLDPLTLVDIDFPNGQERGDIWLDIAREHPSLRGINRESLIRMSANMARFDIYMAAREAVEDAYRRSLVERKYVPVSSDMLFDKLAAYQPLDSQEYKDLEEAVVAKFKLDLDHLEDLLDEGDR